MLSADFYSLIAAAADLCRKPLRHGVIEVVRASDDCCVRLEVRDGSGSRLPGEDLELELYRSGSQLNLTLAWCQFPQRPILWHGSHSVWMDATTGVRCDSPEGAATVEALARRLRALVTA